MARSVIVCALLALAAISPIVEAGVIRQPDVAPIHLLPRPPAEEAPEIIALVASPGFSHATHTTFVVPEAALEHARALLAANQPPPAPAPTAAIEESTVVAAPVRAPAPAPLVPAPAPASSERAWWLPLLWTLPLVGVGGAAAVLALGVRRGSPLERALLLPKPRPKGSRMVPVEPGDVDGILRNGQIAAQRGAYEEAVAWFEAALGSAPKLAVAYFCKGVCLAATGRAADAYGALRAAVEHEPAQMSYRVHFARVALALGHQKEAMDSLELVLRALPELGDAMLEDPQLASLRDHPRFLMMCGAL